MIPQLGSGAIKSGINNVALSVRCSCKDISNLTMCFLLGPGNLTSPKSFFCLESTQLEETELSETRYQRDKRRREARKAQEKQDIEVAFARRHEIVKKDMLNSEVRMIRKNDMRCSW